MNDELAARAGRVLDGARDVPLRETATLVLASAAGVAERAAPGLGAAAARAAADPEAAFFLAAAAGAARAWPGMEGELESLAERLPPVAAPVILLQSEPFLATLDAAWAWRLAVRSLGSAGAAASSFGLFVAARLDAAGAVWPEALAGSERPEQVIRTLRADARARALARGGGAAMADPELSAFMRAPRPDRLFDLEADALLVAAARVDVRQALAVADALCGPGKVGAPALTAVARAAVAAGLGGEIAARAPTLIEWTQAAAASGAMSPFEVEALVARQAPRVLEDAEPGRELDVTAPLLAALALAGRLGAAVALARSAQIAALSLVELFLAVDARAALRALAVDPSFGDWAREGAAVDSRYRVWQTAASGSAQAEALLSALEVGARAPWTAPPGTLADRVGVSGDGGALSASTGVY